ncbi:hypothetical protein F5884DRAFT_642716, partial [Xylogone sp. PMI_703]
TATTMVSGAVTITATGVTTSTPSEVCVTGKGDSNFGGLCSFSCNFGYCPKPCTCTEFGTPVPPPAMPPPPVTGDNGVPLPGEDDSYLGLCSFACNHGYCPGGACTKTSS